MLAPPSTPSKIITLTEKAYFFKGQMQGYGLLVDYENGLIYEGQFSKGQRGKFGRVIQNNGVIYEGKFSDSGQPEGVGTYTDKATKKKIEAVWKNGLPVKSIEKDDLPILKSKIKLLE